MTVQDPGREDASRRVSIVIPVKDDGPRLARCLQALRDQTRRPNEIIVVDNGSSDDSPDIARRAGATVLDCPGGAIPAASAHGYDHASGDLILRLDADCVPDPQWIESVMDAFSRRPEVSALTGGARFIDGPRLLRTPLAAVYLLAYTAMTAPALGHLPLFGSNLAMRREAWASVRSDVHRHSPEIHDDLDLAFHFGSRHRIAYLPGAQMGMSMRPFRSVRALRVRLQRGVGTVTLHWPGEFPPLRWLRLALGARRASEPKSLATWS